MVWNMYERFVFLFDIFFAEQSLDSSQTHSGIGILPPATNVTMLPPELETIVSSRPPTRQPSTGIRTALMTLTTEEMKQQELAVGRRYL